VKRKLVDFVTFRWYSFFRRVLAYFRVNSAKSLNKPDFFIRATYFDQLSGYPRVYPRKREGAVAKASTQSASFLFEVFCDQQRRRIPEGGANTSASRFNHFCVHTHIGRSGPNLKPGTMRVYVTNGRQNGLNIGRKVGPCPGSRRRWVGAR